MTPTLAVSSHALQRAARHDRRTRAWWPPPCLRAAALLAQDAFRRFDARSRDRERPVHDPLTFTEPRPRTLSPDTDMPFLSPKDRRVALPALRHDATFRSRPASEREDASHRLLQPTEDTSTHGPFDSRADAFRRPDRRTRVSAFGRRRFTLRRADLRWRPLDGEPPTSADTYPMLSREHGPRRSRGISPRRYRPRARRTSSL